ncbi:MAG: LEM-3-like GIY-YIG domain-containing protein [bacterium]
MNQSNSEYYVYVYIDPRNFEEFYYGKGKGNRKEAHLTDISDSEKSKRINAINKEGLKPIIKVIAKDLTEREAFLIEKTLIWKLGRTLTNKSSGHFAEKFRPHDTLHLDLAHFDFKNGIYYVNVGEGVHRCWDDCRQYGFLSAGQDRKWSDPIRTLEVGDVVAAYLKGHGYVGIGIVQERAVRVNDFRIDNKPLNQFNLKIPNIYDNCDNEKSEFLVKVKWIKSFNSKDAKWKTKSGLFSTQLIKASLQGQPTTIEFLENEFKVNFAELMIEE